MQKFMQTIKSLGVSKLVRGFASNVAGYQSVGSLAPELVAVSFPWGVGVQAEQGEICPEYDYCLEQANREDACCADPCDLLGQHNPSNNEANYALHLRKAGLGTS